MYYSIPLRMAASLFILGWLLVRLWSRSDQPFTNRLLRPSLCSRRETKVENEIRSTRERWSSKNFREATSFLLPFFLSSFCWWNNCNATLCNSGIWTGGRFPGMARDRSRQICRFLCSLKAPHPGFFFQPFFNVRGWRSFLGRDSRISLLVEGRDEIEKESLSWNPFSLELRYKFVRSGVHGEEESNDRQFNRRVCQIFERIFNASFSRVNIKLSRDSEFVG